MSCPDRLPSDRRCRTDFGPYEADEDGSSPRACARLPPGEKNIKGTASGTEKLKVAQGGRSAQNISSLKGKDPRRRSPRWAARFGQCSVRIASEETLMLEHKNSCFDMPATNDTPRGDSAIEIVFDS